MYHNLNLSKMIFLIIILKIFIWLSKALVQKLFHKNKPLALSYYFYIVSHDGTLFHRKELKNKVLKLKVFYTHNTLLERVCAYIPNLKFLIYPNIL